MSKQAELLEDEFGPGGLKVDFWKIPKPIMQMESLSHGAKLTYAIIYGSAHHTGTAYPTYNYIQKNLGGVSESTLYRYLDELKRARLIRSNQKGRGLSNNYYLLKTPLLGHDESYTNKYVKRVKGEMPKLLCIDDAKFIYEREVVFWSFNPNTTSVSGFPVPPYPVAKKEFNEYKQTCVKERIDWLLFESEVPSCEFEIEECVTS